MSKHKTFSKKIKMLTEKAVSKAAPRCLRPAESKAQDSKKIQVPKLEKEQHKILG